MSLKNHIHLFKDNHKQIITNWLSKKDVLTIIEKKEIDKKYFIKEYATGVIDYYIGVVEGREVIDNCPTIIKLLKYLKDKEVTTQELFIICSGFKNAMLEYAYAINIYSYEIASEIEFIYEKNFSGVLQTYILTIDTYKKRLDLSKDRLDKQEEILIEQSKSAAMGEMISMIAHQWRQPLQTVSILAQKLQLTKLSKGELPDDVVDQIVEDIGLQLDYMSNTINDFKDYFKPQRVKERVKVSTLFDKAFEFLSYMIKIDSIKIVIEKNDECEIEVAISEFEQVLINILKNAKDCMHEQKTINKKIFIRYYYSDDKVVIEIEDNGGGIPPSNISKIFDPYFSTKSEKNGSGLGLYMSKMIIEQHSLGKISALNTKQGALFKIEIPR